jgi:hypothetical protein
LLGVEITGILQGVQTLTEQGGRRRQAARWSAPLPQPEQVADPREYQAMQRRWHPLWGDRRQELAVIGVGLDEARVHAGLDACALTGTEMTLGPDEWRALADPFPAWRRQIAGASPEPAA